MRRALAVLLLVVLPGLAEAVHPRAVFTAPIKARVKAKQQALAADWLALRGAAATTGTSCDRVSQTTAGTGDSLPPVYATRETVTSSPPGYITSGYQGEDYYKILLNLSTCYFGLIDDDSTTANKYKAQAIKVMLAASSPFATLTPASSPTTWGPQTASATIRSSRPIYYVTNTGPAGQARVNIFYQGLTTGATITISGVTGCTTANITGKVGATTAHYFDLNDSGGSPVICNAAGTNYNHNMASDAGYPARFYVTLLALGYDWFYADLSAGQRTQIFDTINGFLDEFRGLYYENGGAYNGTPYFMRPMSNYHAGYFNALGLAGITTRGVGENSRGDEWYTFWHDTIYDTVDQVFHERWLANNAGFPEAMRYQTLSASGLALTLLAQLDANGEDLFSDFPWIQQLPRYWIHNTMPPGGYFSYRGYIASPVDGTGTNPNPWTNEAMWAVHHVMDIKSDAYRTKFKSYIDAQTTALAPAQSYLWNPVVFYDSSLSSTDYKLSEGLSLPQMSNPAGGYGRVSMRSDWTTSAVYGDIWTSPYLSDSFNGKERFDKGSLLVQRGDVHLLIAPTPEATRANNSTAYNFFHAGAGSTSHTYYGIFYAVKDSDSAFIRQNAVGQPGNDYQLAATPRFTTSYPTRIDRYEQQSSYVYTRGIEIEDPYGADAVYTSHRPVAGWAREVLYILPKVFIVYDRTNKANKLSAPTVNYSQFVAWVTGKTPTTAVYGSDMKRTEVSFGGTYKGALTYVKPDGLTTAEVNLGSYGIAYQTRVSPPSETQLVNWLTVVDAADAQASLEVIAKFTTHSNIDAISIGTDKVVGFASYTSGNSPAFPMTYTMSGMGTDVTHRLAGLAASTGYFWSQSGNAITLSNTSGTHPVTSTAAGVITFTSGAVVDPPVVVDTSSPMPAGSVGVAYNQQLAASGGNGSAFTWTKTAGTIPAGLAALTSSGVLAGTPTTATTYNFTVQACDTVPSCNTKALQIVIAANPPQIVQTTVPNGTRDVAYSTTLTLVGGTGASPFTWDVSAGSLCTGLSLSAGGVLSGTPTVVQNCSFTARVTDAGAATDTQTFTIQVVAAPLAISVVATPTSQAVGVRFGAAGLPYGVSCVVTIKQGEITIQSQNSLSGPSKRFLSFTGLSPDTIYAALVDCATAGTGIADFTTLPSDSSGGSQKISFKVPVIAAGTITKIEVKYGIAALSEFSTGDLACTTTCTVTLDGGFGGLTAGSTYMIQHLWKSAGGATLATSEVRYLVVQ